MAFNHRSVYRSDVGLFVLLATPVLNDYVIELLLGFGESDIYRGGAKAAINTFVGVAGVLGLGFALLRLQLADSRAIVGISLFVKTSAAAWLLFAYMQGVSPAFMALAAADFMSALLLLRALVSRNES